ncbi:hypothetical protein [Desulfonatronum thioautotrophicum]|uniref:hypothetical protein n=1 Tax=Desulfonatronum thioautotrophicum TaxID=617001 RepID=UPI0005EB020D|nr:hypothetical protein [Desulfonatronum thioautotrophicum]
MRMKMDVRGKEAIEPSPVSTRYLSGRERVCRPVLRVVNHKWRFLLERQPVWALLALLAVLASGCDLQQPAEPAMKEPVGLHGKVMSQDHPGMPEPGNGLSEDQAVREPRLSWRAVSFCTPLTSGGLQVIADS